MNNENLKNIMSITVENLAKKQHDAIKEHVLDVLQNISELIKEEKYDQIEKFTFYSGQGDGWGNARENDVINFAYLDNDVMDIIEITDVLKNLKDKTKQNITGG